jgi:hypothetical protein
LLAANRDYWLNETKKLEKRLVHVERYGTWDYWALVAISLSLAFIVFALLTSDPACVKGVL